MASKTSFFNRTIYKRNFSRFWPIAAFYGLIWFVSQTLLVRSNIENSLRWDMTLKEIKTDVGGTILRLGFQEGALVSFIFGGLVAMAVFSYLYSSRSATALHALPIRREEHFISNYLSGLTMLILPNIVIFLATSIMEASYGVLDINVMLKWFAVVSLQNVFFFSFASLCAIVSGHLLALPVFYTIFNVLVVGLELLIVSTVAMFIYGMKFDQVVTLEAFSPIVRYLSDTSLVNTPEGWRYTILCAVAGLVFAAIALLLYRKRRVESAGDIIAFGALKPVFKYGVAFCAALALGMLVYLISFGDNRSDVWLFVLCMILMGSIGYFVAEALLRKTLRVFGRAWKGWLCFCVVLVGIGACIRMDAFGFEQYVPKLENIESAIVSEFSRPYTGESTRTIYMNGAYFVSQNEEETRAVLQLHESVIARHEEYRDFDYSHVDGWSFSITYRMKDGSVIGRSYTIPMTDALLGVPDTPAALYDALINNPETLSRLYFPDNLTEEHFSNGTITLMGERYTLSQAQSYILYEALLKDLKAGQIGQRNLLNWMDGYPAWIELRFMGYFPEWVGAPADETPYERAYYANFTLQPGSKYTIQTLEYLHILNLDEFQLMERGEEDRERAAVYEESADISEMM
ncbi:MAG TPA: ABC transporter permease [Papillibacter sp.]|nr:ABC transporter permease [Papillibacter sp.]